ncbi:nicotinate-nucleotide--dimethylbenzimidazole phosphoribosyltransferase [Halobium salinum]|uniref:UPF0284 protein ACFO0N_11255 n=1 Tax=Halobium salinum TaxID=1364940 RepID=A0ABD5PCA6_9EURY|nr:nicotinate-nucleotide--dimethylbenzimidazole phosphoribosyltransferase [Halobium salinum]
MRLVLVAGNTETARIDGISAAGASPAEATHTPSADAELVSYGRLVEAPSLPRTPGGCPSPALVTRAVRELVNVECTVVDAGIGKPTAAPTVAVGATPGRDIREATAVSNASALFVGGRRLGSRLPDRRLVIGETVPGGTTTAMGVLRALDEDAPVSSSLSRNPIELKRSVVAKGLDASGLAPGDAAGEPTTAVEAMGDPTLPVVAGLVVGALETDKRVLLGGGTQMLAVAALVRHADVDGRLSLATTRYLADAVPDFTEAAAGFDADVRVTDPGFDALVDLDEPTEPVPDGGGGAGSRGPAALARFAAGEMKEGSLMGGALALAAHADVLDEVARESVDLLAALR